MSVYIRKINSIVLLATLSAVLISCAQPAPAAVEPSAPEAVAPAAPADDGQLKESPMLAELVKAGKLPKVEDRVPKQPMIVGPGVILSMEDLPDWKSGEFGGTLRSAHSSANWNPDVFVMSNEPLLISPGIGTDKIIGNVLAGYEVSADGKSIKFNMREGMKWSDGEPVTSEDVRFVYEDVMKNLELSPNGVAARWRVGASPTGAEPTVTIIDKYNFSISYPEPYGGLLRQFTIEAWVGYTEFLLPAHHMKQFHVKYADPAKLKALLAEAKLKDDEWVALYNQKLCLNWHITNPRCIGFPGLWPFLITNDSSGVLTWERNPYYFKVDVEGKQLPYIDKVVSQQLENVEAIQLKILAGEIDFQRESTALVKIPLYKENEEKGGFRVVLLDMHVHSTTLELNQTFENTSQKADWAKVSQDVRFRKALSLGINRPEIIEAIYYGYASLPLKSVGEDNSKYDVAAANKLLDEMGLTNKDSAGFRTGTDGQPLQIFLEHGGHAPDISPIAEILGADMGAIGIKVQVKQIGPELWGTRRGSNDLMATVFWSHDQGWGGGLGMVGGESVSRAGNLWDTYYNSNGASGVKPPEWITKGRDLNTAWWIAVPGSAEYNQISEDAFAWQRENLPVIGIVENVKYPMIASKKLGNVSSSGFAIALNFAGEQLFFTK